MATARRSASEQVAEELRAHIRREALAPGDRLGREADLAARFGVSRPTLREALRLLASAHLVRAAKGPGGGIFVAATPEEGMGLALSQSVASMLAARTVDLDELLEARMLWEIPLAGLAAQRATPEQVAAMRALLEEADGLEPGSARFEAIDREVHRLLTVAAGNRLSATFMGWVVDVLQPVLAARIQAAVVPSALTGQHRDLVRAIERGDPTAAERAMREHLLYLRDLLSIVEELDPELGPPGTADAKGM